MSNLYPYLVEGEGIKYVEISIMLFIFYSPLSSNSRNTKSIYLSTIVVKSIQYGIFVAFQSG